MTSILTLPSHMTGFLHELGTQSGIYSYVSKPRRMCPSPGQGGETRREARQLSLMSDRRVVRGNTYSGTISHHTTHSSIQVKRRSVTANTRNTNRSVPSARLSQLGRDPLKGGRRGEGGPGRLTVPPVAGRRHQTLQTDQWLEEISDKREEKEMAVQVNLTDDWEQGGTKKGSKKRIELDNKINMEDKVEIVLTAIIGKTVEQSMTEVIQEEEILRARQFKQQHIETVTAFGN